MQQWVLDVFLRRKNRQQIESLKNETDRARPKHSELVGVLPGDILVGDENASAAGRVDAANQVKQGRFAASRWAGNGHEHALINIEADAIERGYPLVAQAVLLADVLYPHKHSRGLRYAGITGRDALRCLRIQYRSSEVSRQDCRPQVLGYFRFALRRGICTALYGAPKRFDDRYARKPARWKQGRADGRDKTQAERGCEHFRHDLN